MNPFSGLLVLFITCVILISIVSDGASRNAVENERCTVRGGKIMYIQDSHRVCVKSIEYIDVSK